MELLRSALRSLAGSKTRSFLTMLGIIIGAASVIVMVSVGKGASSVMEDYIATFGANIMHVFPQAPKNASSGARAAMGSGYFLTLEDARVIAEESFTTTCAVPFAFATVQLIYGNNNWNTRINGSTPDFLRVRPFEVERGIFITDTDVRSGSKVCVLGEPEREITAILRRNTGYTMTPETLTTSMNIMLVTTRVGIRMSVGARPSLRLCTGGLCSYLGTLRCWLRGFRELWG